MREKLVVFVTSGRSDYALLEPVLKRLADTAERRSWSHKLMITGAHCTQEGDGVSFMTLTGVPRETVPLGCPEAMDHPLPNALALCIGTAVNTFAQAFSRNRPDLVFLMGDRYEVFAAAVAAYSMRIPIAHAYGGEYTHGSLDNGWRDSITMLSRYHFASHCLYADRIRDMVGNARQITVLPGYTSLDNLVEWPRFDRATTLSQAAPGLSDAPYVLMTLHPDTTQSLEYNLRAVEEVLAGIDGAPEFNYIITPANQDPGGPEMNQRVSQWAVNRGNVACIPSAGIQLYLSLMLGAYCLLGNSSSGVIEAPYVGRPSINLGDRQLGRIWSLSVKDAPLNAQEIQGALRTFPSTVVQGTGDSEFRPGASDVIIKTLGRILE